MGRAVFYALFLCFYYNFYTFSIMCANRIQFSLLLLANCTHFSLANRRLQLNDGGYNRWLRSRDPIDRNGQAILPDLRHHRHSADVGAAVGGRRAPDDPGHMAAGRAKRQARPPVSAVQHTHPALVGHRWHRVRADFHCADGHIRLHGDIVELDGRVLLLLHIADNDRTGRLHSRR